MIAAASGLVTLLAGCSAADGPRSAPSPLDSVVPAERVDVPTFDAPADQEAALSEPPATNPVEAVRRYLAAEVDGTLDRSYGALSRESQDDVGSIGEWVDSAPQRPTIVEFQIDPAAGDAASGVTTVVVASELALEPRLDEVSGFVPRQATVDWMVVAEDGGWRIDLSGSSLEPILPDEQGATEAAELWAAARQECRVDGEYEGSLLGSPALGDELCQLEGTVVAGPPAPLEDAMTAQVVAAFGPDALRWTRTVPISAPLTISVVTAPYDDHWVVVGVAS